MTRVADTSALYALFDKDDPHHRKAFAALQDPDPIFLPTEILGETIDLIDYRVDWSVARDALADLLAMPNVRVLDRVTIDAVKRIHDAGEGRVSFHDALVIHACQLLGASPLTFDEGLLEIAKDHGVT